MAKVKNKLTEEEKKEWNELYNYLKKEIFHYDEKQKLSETIVLSVLGIRYGKAIENRNIPDKAKYPFRVILFTFMSCKKDIEYAIRTKNFKNENKMMAYIRKIIDANINDVYERYKQSINENDMYLRRLKKNDNKHIDRNKKLEYKKKSKNASERLNKYL